MLELSLAGEDPYVWWWWSFAFDMHPPVAKEEEVPILPPELKGITNAIRANAEEVAENTGKVWKERHVIENAKFWFIKKLDPKIHMYVSKFKGGGFLGKASCKTHQ